jgi:hypothetical protein
VFRGQRKSDKSVIFQKYIRKAIMCKNRRLSDEIIGRAVICQFYPLIFFTIVPPVTTQFLFSNLQFVLRHEGRSQWPRVLRRRSTAARLLRLWVRIPPGAWMFVCYECCVLSGRGICDGLITRPEKSYRLWRVVVCGQETSRMRGLRDCENITTMGCNARKTNKQHYVTREYVSCVCDMVIECTRGCTKPLKENE